MSHKQLLFSSAARVKVLRGAAALADAVRITLGPKSRSVLIEKEWGRPLVCNDGVTIAKEVELKDPGYGERRQAMLQDLSVLTDGRVIAEELGGTFEKLTPEDLGKAKRVLIDKDTTTIIEGVGPREAIAARCKELRRQIEETTSDYDREKLRERLAKLADGVAVLRVGAPSEAELKSRKEAFEDAISATKAAVAERIVPGGGLALLRAIESVAREEAGCAGDERTGLLILKRALEAPVRQIAENSGVDGGGANALRDGKSGGSMRSGANTSTWLLPGSSTRRR